MISKNDLKTIRSLKIKKNRIEEGRFLVEGLKNVTELLNSNFEVDTILVTEEYKKHLENHLCEIVTKKQLNSVSTLSNIQSCVAVAKIMPFDEHDLQFSDHIILLDGVRDPGNLGAIIRSLDWFGFRQLICSQDCADFYNSKTISATMGSFTRVAVHYADVSKWILDNKLHVYALTLDGKPLEKFIPSEPSVFVLGSESHGIRKEILRHCQSRITISGAGDAESLNVAMAASILLYQLRLSKM